MTPGAAAIWKELPTAQRRMIATLLLAVALANIAQPFPDLAPLQHGPTIAVACAAPWILGRWPLSNRAVGCVWLFLLLHTLGARYTYSSVPYDAWMQALTGRTLSDLLGLQRNGYDRMVHFAFGALLTPPILEAAVRHAAMPRKPALLFAFACIGLGSALYEIFEWLLTVVATGKVEGEIAYKYNGQQGDAWDAQKDMACAVFASATYGLWVMIGWSRKS